MGMLDMEAIGVKGGVIGVSDEVIEVSPPWISSADGPNEKRTIKHVTNAKIKEEIRLIDN